MGKRMGVAAVLVDLEGRCADVVIDRLKPNQIFEKPLRVFHCEGIDRLRGCAIYRERDLRELETGNDDHAPNLL